MLVIGLVACLGALAAAQSNYASQGNSIEYSNEGLPDSTLLDGKVTKLDDISPVISLNRTKAALNCAAGFMQIELKFDEPFYGIAYADFDRASACQVAGKGTHTATIELPLKGCGTKQDPQRVFTNNIVVRFHPALEMEGDEVITIVCRYPPPVAPPPAGVPNFIKEEPLPASPLAPPLKGLQILLIICGILFLSLVLLGLGCSYYMLRRRRVQVVRRHPLSTGTGSEITKLSGSSLGHISLLGGLKIPRAHAPLPPSSSGSEALPSDYPSESPSSAHSELEDVETRRSLSSGGSYQNKAFLHDSYYSEQLLHEVVSVAHKRPPPEPKFDVQVRVKKAAPPPPSPTPPPSESEMSMKAAERNLTTILEREENAKTTFSYVPEIHPPPLYSTVMRKQPQVSRTTEESYTAEDTVDITLRRPSLATLNTEMTETRSMSEIVEKTATKYSPPPPLLPSSHYVAETETQVELIEPPVVVSRRPEIKSHVVDDVFLRTITEKRTVEDVERHRRKVTETRKPPAPPAKWDVSIRNYPGPEVPAEDSATDWESYSETSSIAGPPPPRRSELREVRRTETETERSYLRAEAPPPLHNWEVLLRVLEPAETEVADDRSDVTSLVEQSLTAEDRRKWREIITTESTLRTMLTEATVREDYERIRRDRRYEKLFEPEKWDVIVRVLAPPTEERPTYDQRGGGGNNKYRRKADWDTRSRRSSLPTLYEYDSDGGSSVRTLTMETGGTRSQARSRRSSYRSDMDLRSMSEVTVDFGRERESLSEASSYYRYHPRRNLTAEEEDYAYEEERSLTRSLSQPSLARSGSEFTEQWGLRVPPHSSGASYSLSQSSYSRSQAQAWFADADSEASFK